MMAFYCFQRIAMLSCWAILSIPQQGNFSSLREVGVKVDVQVICRFLLYSFSCEEGRSSTADRSKEGHVHVLCLGFSPLPLN